MERAIVAALEAGPEQVRVIHLRTMHVGPDTLLVAAKIAVRAQDSAASLAAAIDNAERRVRAAVPIAELIYLEPDLYQAAPRRCARPGGAGRPPVVAARRDPRAPRPGPVARRPAQRAVRRSDRLSSRCARSFSKSSARAGGAWMRPIRLPSSATSPRAAGSASTRSPKASAAGLMS